MHRNPESKQFWRLCGPLLIYWVILFAARFIVELIVMAPNMAQIIDYGEITNSMTQGELMDIVSENAEKLMTIVRKYQVQILGVSALFTIPLTATLFFMDRKRERILNIPQNNKAKMWKYTGVVLLGAAFCIGANSLTVMSKLALSNVRYEEVSQIFYSAPIWVQFLCLGIILPLTEELMFRGVVFRRYREQGGFFRSAFISSLLFALTHGNVVQLVYTLVLGVFLAYVYEKYGSFKAPLILHIVANMTSLVLTNTKGFDWLFAEPLRMGIGAVVCAFVVSVIFVMIQRIQERPIGENLQGGL